jgi:hypothetical protein
MPAVNADGLFTQCDSAVLVGVDKSSHDFVPPNREGTEANSTSWLNQPNSFVVDPKYECHLVWIDDIQESLAVVLCMPG